MDKILPNQFNLFFDGTVSDYFDGYRELYLGDKDFIFADDLVNITAEIKVVSANAKFTGKKLTLNQAREYASNVGVIDNYGRTQTSFLFESHPYVNDPYVIITPFVQNNEIQKDVKKYLDFNKSKMLYIHRQDQFSRWLASDHTVGVTPQKPLLCV